MWIKRISAQRRARLIAVSVLAMAAGYLALGLVSDRHQRQAQATHSRPINIVLLSSGSTNAPSSLLSEPLTTPALPSMQAELETVQPATPQMPALTAAQSCPIDMALDADAGAMIDLTLVAPCHGGERVVLRHAGLAVTGRLDPEGNLALRLPALVSDARVEVQFSDGNTVDGVVAIEEAATMRRFGVQWQGGAAFALHGFENGADFGQPGHVSPSQPAGPSGARLAVLGDATVDLPLLAQIFTYPSAEIPVELLVEAAVTTETCGHDLLGEVLTVEQGLVKTTDLTLAMPDCSGVGDFLVLKNLAAEMKLAAN